jgi:hypothetical protein
MGNHGKVQRVIREAVATLVEELGPEEAAKRLEAAAAQLRGTVRNHSATTAHDKSTTLTRPRAVANR